MSLSILNVGEGDTKLTFDSDKPEEIERAKKIVTAMLRRGFAILVKVGERDGKPHYRRAKAFDEAKCEYIVMDAPDDDAPVADPPASARRGRARRIPAKGTKAVSVARSAGGCARKVW